LLAVASGDSAKTGRSVVALSPGTSNGSEQDVRPPPAESVDRSKPRNLRTGHAEVDASITMAMRCGISTAFYRPRVTKDHTGAIVRHGVDDKVQLERTVRWVDAALLGTEEVSSDPELIGDDEAPPPCVTHGIERLAAELQDTFGADDNPRDGARSRYCNDDMTLFRPRTLMDSTGAYVESGLRDTAAVDAVVNWVDQQIAPIYRRASSRLEPEEQTLPGKPVFTLCECNDIVPIDYSSVLADLDGSDPIVAAHDRHRTPNGPEAAIAEDAHEAADRGDAEGAAAITMHEMVCIMDLSDDD
jgi:hypothetical protein